MTRSSSVSFGNSMRPADQVVPRGQPSSGMRMRIAPSSSYAFPSATSRSRLLAAVLHPVELERDRAVPVEAEPAQRLLNLVDRLGDLAARVGVLDPQAELAALVTGEEPVEERRVYPADVEKAGRARREADDWRHGAIVGVVQLGAHVSAAGGIHTAIDRIEAIGGDSVQVFTQSPRAWRPTNHDPATFERFKERREEAGIDGVLCHALYLVNLASPKEDLYEKSVAALCNTVDVACAIDADGVVFHVGSHLGAGLDEGLERVCAALTKALERCSGTTWLLMENTAGAGGDDRPVDRASWR